MIALALFGAALWLAPAPPPKPAQFTMVFSTRRVRDEGFSDAARSILVGLPALRAFSRTQTDVLADFDTVVIETAEPRSEDEVALVIKHHLTRDEMKKRVEAAQAELGQDIRWETRGSVVVGQPFPADGSRDDDPRWVTLPNESLYVFGPLSTTAAFTDPDVPENRVEARRLRTLLRDANRKTAPLLHGLVDNLPAAVKSVYEVPTSADFKLSGAGPFKLEFKTTHASAEAAEEFERWWTHDLHDAIEANLSAKLAFGQLYAATKVRRTGVSVQLRTRLKTEQLELILQVVGSGVEREQARVRGRREARGAQSSPEAAAEP